MSIGLGDLAEDTVSGYRGRVIGMTQWMTGCRTYALQSPVLPDGKLPEVEWFDEVRLKPLQRAEEPAIAAVEAGGPSRGGRQPSLRGE